MNPILSSIGGLYTLYDADTLASVEPELFDTGFHEARGTLQGDARGRGKAHFFVLQEVSAVLRHYLRGGWMRFMGDRFLWTGLERSRALREWRLLSKLSEQGLPVPRPIAARVVRRGFVYRADIIIARIEHTHALASRLQKSALPSGQWEHIGRCLRRFHEAGVDHADLNAHNILLDDRDGIYLIDFDRGRQRCDGQSWKRRNLSRLHRSLRKLKRSTPGFAFDAEDFRRLLRGYHAVASTHGMDRSAL
jgi:3-deoxy-D-manno-octulosonic acid kinase